MEKGCMTRRVIRFAHLHNVLRYHEVVGEGTWWSIMMVQVIWFVYNSRERGSVRAVCEDCFHCINVIKPTGGNLLLFYLKLAKLSYSKVVLLYRHL